MTPDQMIGATILGAILLVIVIATIEYARTKVHLGRKYDKLIKI